MMTFIDKFETFIMLAAVVMLATVDLGWLIIKDMLTPPVFLLDIADCSNFSEFFSW